MWPYMDPSKDLLQELGNAIRLLRYQMEKTGVIEHE